MKKAAVLSILCAVVLLALAVIAEAQQPKVYRIGFLRLPSASSESSESACETARKRLLATHLPQTRLVGVNDA